MQSLKTWGSLHLNRIRVVKTGFNPSPAFQMIIKIFKSFSPSDGESRNRKPKHFFRRRTLKFNFENFGKTLPEKFIFPGKENE